MIIAGYTNFVNKNREIDRKKFKPPHPDICPQGAEISPGRPGAAKGAGVFGRLLEDGVTITLEGVRTGTVDYDTEYQLNMSLYSGQTRVVQSGKEGYTATTYKIWWDAQGNEIRREELCKSRYQATNQIIEYGP